MELEKSHQYLNGFRGIPEFKISRRINADDYSALTTKVTKARALAYFFGTQLDYPFDRDYPVGYLKEYSLTPNPDEILKFGLNVLIDKKTAMTDYYIHLLTPKDDLQVVFFIDGTFLFQVTDENSRIKENISGLIKDMNEQEFTVVSELLDRLTGDKPAIVS